MFSTGRLVLNSLCKLSFNCRLVYFKASISVGLRPGQQIIMTSPESPSPFYLPEKLKEELTKGEKCSGFFKRKKKSPVCAKSKETLSCSLVTLQSIIKENLK